MFWSDAKRVGVELLSFVSIPVAPPPFLPDLAPAVEWGVSQSADAAVEYYGFSTETGSAEVSDT